MNKEKISDFVDAWAQTVKLTDARYINVIKSDIAKRCAMYEKEIPSISIKDDDCDAYIIKPTNGEYSLEDFFLNRLMLGIIDVDFSDSLENTNGSYFAYGKQFEVGVNAIKKRIEDKATRHRGLQGKAAQIIMKTIEHELGHCFKTSFTNGYRLSEREHYEKLIEHLINLKDGKYTSQIKTMRELPIAEELEPIKTGVSDTKYSIGYRDARTGEAIHTYRDIKRIDELLNETEALELTNSNEVHEKWALQDENDRDSSSGNYVDVYNYLSGYRSYTGYGSILKALLGKEDCFYAEYISSVDIFQKFNSEYSDIVQDVWGLDPKEWPPIKCLDLDFETLEKSQNLFDEKTMLKLDEFFAKCYERKIEKYISQGNGTLSPDSKDKILEEIKLFQSRLTTNNDPKKREQLIHNVIFNNIKTRINELSIQNNQKMDSSKMKFIKGLIQAYNDTEEEHQYKKRADTDLMDIERLKDIIETKGMNRMLISDLDGKWIGAPEDEDFKVQYSQKQVSAMARLLKVAQLLTESKKLNPECRNYLEEFVDIPNIEYKLKQMRADLNDENSYMYELKQKSKDNRKNGNIPSYPPTQAEIEARENINPVLSPEEAVEASDAISDFESQARRDLSRNEKTYGNTK